MKFISVKLKDYGLYRGEVEFDLAPRQNGSKKKRVILFGGKNGAGKTTLLEAVKLGLYGKVSQGRISENNYQKYLKSKIHRSRGELFNPQDASIEIVFDLATGGESSRYKITRSWVGNNGSDSHEKLRLEKNGKLVDDIEPEFQQEFISNIVPENLSQLFFFDGEKIQAIAEDITSNAAIAESVQMLLGLDIVQKLQADLAIYSQREAKKSASKADLDLLKKHESKLSDLERALEILTQQKGATQNKLDINFESRSKSNKELSEKGGAFAATLEAEKTIELEAEAQRIVIEKQIRQEVESTFALSLCPKIAKNLLERIESENKKSDSGRVIEEVQELKESLLTSLATSRKIKTDIEEALSIVDTVFDEKLSNLKTAAGTDTLLGNAHSENQKILGWLEASEKNKKNVIELCAELEIVYRKQSESRRKQRRAPDTDTLKPIFEKISELNQEKGALDERIASFNDSIQTVELKINETKRAIEKIILANRKIEAGKRQLELADKAQKALDEYSERLIEKKINDLRKSIAECFNHLVRKNNFVEDVVINPETFEVTLYDKNQIRIQKDELSSGEKQLFAISVLWALAKSSGRELPVIIDTPLGRLDSEHRINLVKHYFPNAAHQVIILSTDTEVDKGLFEELKPSVSHCYHLKYNKTETRTSAKTGYFWGQNNGNS